MNFSSFVGRVSSGFFVRPLGVLNMIAFSTFTGSALIFAMIGLRSVASVVVIAIIYGFSAGIGK